MSVGSVMWVLLWGLCNWAYCMGVGYGAIMSLLSGDDSYRCSAMTVIAVRRQCRRYTMMMPYHGDYTNHHTSGNF